MSVLLKEDMQFEFVSVPVVVATKQQDLYVFLLDRKRLSLLQLFRVSLQG